MDMLQPDDLRIFSKTAAGAAEVTARSAGLSPTVRRVLILIDGHRTVAELAPMVRPGEIPDVIGELVTRGFIVTSGSPQAAPPPPVATPIAPAPATLSEMNDAGRYISLDEAKRRLVRALTDRLGPVADMLALKIERAESADELRVRLRDADRLIIALMGHAAAEDFRRVLRRGF